MPDNNRDTLEIGDIERRATVDVDLDTMQVPESQVAVIEVIRDGEPPWVKIEVYGEWGEVSAILSIDDARDIRDRLTEVIGICEDHDDEDLYVYLCDHCLREVDPEDATEEDGRHYHSNCPNEPAAGGEAA